MQNEELKTKLELAKTQVEQLKVWSFMLLTIGTGVFSVLFWIYGKEETLLKTILVLGVTLMFVIAFKFLETERKTNKVVKELQKEIGK